MTTTSVSLLPGQTGQHCPGTASFVLKQTLYNTSHPATPPPSQACDKDCNHSKVHAQDTHLNTSALTGTGRHCPCYHVTNEEVHARIQQAIRPHEDLTIIKRHKLQWYGHFSHSSGLTKTILQGTVKRGDKADRGRGGKTTTGNGQA